MMEQKIVVDAVIVFKRKILMVKRAMDAEFLPGYWEFPGGKIEFKEFPEDALRREVKEECGINIKTLRPLVVDNFFIEKNSSERQFINIFFYVKFWAMIKSD